MESHHADSATDQQEPADESAANNPDGHWFARSRLCRSKPAETHAATPATVTATMKTQSAGKRVIAPLCKPSVRPFCPRV